MREKETVFNRVKHNRNILLSPLPSKEAFRDFQMGYSPFENRETFSSFSSLLNPPFPLAKRVVKILTDT